VACIAIFWGQVGERLEPGGDYWGGELVRFLGLHRSPFCELHNTIVGLAMVHKQPDTTRL
jgi:hypothetical protein